MVINWSQTAISDLKEYKLNSRIYTQNKLDNYIISLGKYVDNLYISPRLGKLLFSNNNLEFRQLVYEMHKIFYCLYHDEIRILSVVHTSHNIENIVKYLSFLFYN